MAQLSFTCPYCRTEKAAFSARGAVPFQPGAPINLLFMQCRVCGNGIVVRVAGSTPQLTLWMQDSSSSPGNIVDIQPQLIELKAPADVPGNIHAAYMSGLDNLSRTNGANAAAIMFRRTVELAVKKLNPEGQGNLKKRIAELPDNLATPAMKAWATHVRLEANEAAHEPEEFSEEDAKTLHTYAEMFLTYAFTLPAMLKRTAPEQDLKDLGELG
jgi:hypothetical protein